jgi:hypothetical protein
MRLNPSKAGRPERREQISNGLYYLKRPTTTRAPMRPGMRVARKNCGGPGLKPAAREIDLSACDQNSIRPPSCMRRGKMFCKSLIFWEEITPKLAGACNEGIGSLKLT